MPARGEVNESAIAHYRAELEYMRQLGIQPLLTIHHFSNPMWFERLGAFSYSEEEGTFDAENFEDSVPQDVKDERLRELMDEQREISLTYNKTRIGSEIKVLIDDFNDGVFVCRSEFESPEVDGEILVHYDADKMSAQPEDMIGTFMTVRVVNADEYDLVAEIV